MHFYRLTQLVLTEGCKNITGGIPFPAENTLVLLGEVGYDSCPGNLLFPCPGEAGIFSQYPGEAGIDSCYGTKGVKRNSGKDRSGLYFGSLQNGSNVTDQPGARGKGMSLLQLEAAR